MLSKITGFIPLCSNGSIGLNGVTKVKVNVYLFFNCLGVIFALFDETWRKLLCSLRNKRIHIFLDLFDSINLQLTEACRCGGSYNAADIIFFPHQRTINVIAL
jgi:hypothetical protein